MPPVAFILGYGTNVGAAVAALLKEKGYAVAVGARSIDAAAAAAAGLFPVALDVGSAESVLAAFEAVRAALGAPSVVVYNAASHKPLPVPGDPLSLAPADFAAAVAVGTHVFAAARAALPGLRAAAARGARAAFVVTGNALPHGAPAAAFVALGAQKTLAARLVAGCARAYAAEGLGFYFASLVSETGGVPPYEVFRASGAVHARVYWELISAGGGWDHRFTADGKKLAGYECSW